MTEFCRAEALLTVEKHNRPQVSCALRFWDGNQATFDVVGAPYRGFDCHADELWWSPPTAEKCLFYDPA